MICPFCRVEFADVECPLCGAEEEEISNFHEAHKDGDPFDGYEEKP